MTFTKKQVSEILKTNCYFIKQIGRLLKHTTNVKEETDLLRSLNFLLNESKRLFQVSPHRKNPSEKFIDCIEDIRTMVRLLKETIPILLTQEEKRGNRAKIKALNESTQNARLLLLILKKRIALAKKTYPKEWTVFHDAEFDDFR